jgi:hypothetical protein
MIREGGDAKGTFTHLVFQIREIFSFISRFSASSGGCKLSFKKIRCPAQREVMKKAVLAILCAVLLIVGCHGKIHQSLPSGLSDGALIEDVIVRGNRAISIAAIVSNIQTKRGDRLSVAVIKSDINRLYSLGFDDVRVEETNGTNGIGKILYFDVKEKQP